MDTHVIRFVIAHPSGETHELAQEFASSLDLAVGLAVVGTIRLRAEHGQPIGYVIEDSAGRRVRAVSPS